MRLSGDHPRVCGEYWILATSLASGLGSPPRVRGILDNPNADSSRHRITPACAGNTSKTHALAGIRQDHPRVCGEYLKADHLKAIAEGSPPRVRGIQLQCISGICLFQITPACAGNTMLALKATLWPRDHPRVCGEYNCFILSYPPCKGSPPRVRGILDVAQSGPDAAGITPACAGNTVAYGISQRGHEDHPRVCGEY